MICNAEALNKITSRAIMFVPTRSANDILHCFRFFQNELEATDFNVHGKFKLPEGLVFDQEIKVKASVFASVLGNMKGDIVVEPTDKTLEIKSTLSSFSLPLSSGPYANCPSPPDDFIKDAKIVRAMKAVYPYTSKQATGSRLRASEGVIIHKNNVIGFLNNAMSYMTIDHEVNPGIIIGREIVKKLPTDAIGGFASDSRRAYFSFGDCLLSSALLEGQLPPYEAIKNTEFTSIARIMTDDLRTAISNIFVMREGPSIAKARFVFSKDKISIHTEGDMGKFDTTIKGSVTGDCQFLLDVEYVQKLLSSIKSNTVRIGYRSPRDAVGFSGFMEKEEKEEHKLSVYVAQIMKEFGEENVEDESSGTKPQ